MIWDARELWTSRVLAQGAGDRIAFTTNTHSTTTGDLLEMAAGAAAWLDARGAQEGRPVAALLDTSAESLALVIAGACTGRPVAPLGARLTPHELARCLSSLDSALLVTEPKFESVAKATAALVGISLAVLEDLPADAHLLKPQDQPDAIMAILHTSGTTGHPKAVPITQQRLTSRTIVSSRLMGLTSQSVYASGSPFYHIAGLGNLAVMLAIGATITPLPLVDAHTGQALAAHRVTHAFLVPTMIERLLTSQSLGLPTLELLQYGAAPIRHPTLVAAVEALPGVRFINMFGQTEGSPITCLTPEDHLLAQEGRPDLLASVGRAAPGIELQILNPDPSGVGEVLARGDHLFRVSPDGWLHTGDLGRVDEAGYLFLVGRQGDRIKRGGENVQPVEVEDVLALYPGIREAAVVGVPDGQYGQAVKAYVVLSDDAEGLDTDNARAFVRQYLSGFKVPTQWEVLDELPRNTSGKLLRRSLQ